MRTIAAVVVRIVAEIIAVMLVVAVVLVLAVLLLLLLLVVVVLLPQVSFLGESFFDFGLSKSPESPRTRLGIWVARGALRKFGPPSLARSWIEDT